MSLFNAGGGGIFGQTQSGSGLFGAQQQQPGGMSLFGTQQQPQGSAPGGLFGAQQPTGTGLFGTQQQSGATGSFGAQQQQPTGSGLLGGSGLFGSQQQPSLFGAQQQQPAGIGLFGMQQQPGGTTLFGAPQQQLGGTNVLGSQQQPGQGSLLGPQQSPQQTGVFGALSSPLQSRPLFGGQGFGGGNAPMASGLLGLQSAYLGGNQFGQAFGQGMTSSRPYGVNLQGDASQQSQRDTLRASLFGIGIDINNLPAPLLEILPRLQNPDTRALYTLIRIIARILSIKDTLENNEEMTSYVFCRAATPELAGRFQLQVDQAASLQGPSMVEKLNKAKKSRPEPRGLYYTEPIVGFPGLIARVGSQGKFLEQFTATVKGLQDKQAKAHEAFQERAVERLHQIRNRQADLRHNIISLVGTLDELAVRAQSFEGDPLESAQILDEYEKLRRQIETAPNSLKHSCNSLNRKVEELKSRLTELTHASDTAKSAGGQVSRLGSKAELGSQRDLRIQEAVQVAETQEGEIERIRKRFAALWVDLQDVSDRWAGQIDISNVIRQRRV